MEDGDRRICVVSDVRGDALAPLLGEVQLGSIAVAHAAWTARDDGGASSSVFSTPLAWTECLDDVVIHVIPPHGKGKVILGDTAAYLDAVWLSASYHRQCTAKGR